MEPERSLPRSQELYTCTNPERDQSSPQHLVLVPLVTTAWLVLPLQIEGRSPAMEGSCEYIE
jgi:hypothetical protein